MNKYLNPQGYNYGSEPYNVNPFWDEDREQGVIEPLTITPKTEVQDLAAPQGVDGYNPITVNAVDATIDENIIPENIKKDIVILGITGTLESGGGEPKLQEKTAKPKTTSQTITPDEGYDGLSQVIVDKVDATIDENIIPENIKKDISILGITGTLESGSGGGGGGEDTNRNVIVFLTKADIDKVKIQGEEISVDVLEGKFKKYNTETAFTPKKFFSCTIDNGTSITIRTIPDILTIGIKNIEDLETTTYYKRFTDHKALWGKDINYNIYIRGIPSSANIEKSFYLYFDSKGV